MNDRPRYIAWHRETGRHYVLQDWDEAVVFLWGKKADEWDLYRQIKVPLNLSCEPKEEPC